MAAHVGFWQVEDEPAAADIGGGKAEFIPKEGSERFRFR
jgi:hypothetical protein